MFLEKHHLAYIKLISLFIMVLCSVKTLCFSLLTIVFDLPAKSDSCLRRIQWFFSEPDLNLDLIARVIFRLLPAGKRAKASWQFNDFLISYLLLNQTLTQYEKVVMY